MEKYQTPAKKKYTASDEKRKARVQSETDDVVTEQRVNLLPPGLMSDLMEGVSSLMDDFTDVANNNLNALQRRRKVGPGVRNYGFIEKVADLAEVNPQFAQFFGPADFRNCVRNVETCRSLALSLQSFARAVTNTMLIYSDDAYSMALIFYNMVKEMSRRGDPAAMELFKTLRPFFKRTRRAAAEPTEKELERDLRALLRGRKDGKIIVENVTPKQTAGARKIIDTSPGRRAVNETVEAEIKG